MSVVVRRTFLAFVLMFVLLTTAAWQSNHVLAQGQELGLPDTPLYPGITWSEPAVSTQNIRINTQGDSISLSGERYEALEPFSSGFPQEVLEYYSNEQLAKSGWSSYDSFGTADGDHYVFYHDAGVYLSVEFLSCPDTPYGICLVIWKSEQTRPLDVTTSTTSEPDDVTATSTFGKTSPQNTQTDLNPASVTLSWQAYSGADKYKYCINKDSACAKDDPDWMSTYDRSVTLNNLAYNQTYYWQVKATTCETCVPKEWVYADNDTAWRFKTKTGTGTQVTILGNAGVSGAVLSYTDGSLKQVTADGTGAYSLKVSYNWTGTVTPSKSGYVFSPAAASFTNLTAPQTIQNFIATPIYTISGNTGQPLVTLSYVNGTPQTVVSDTSGNYSISVSAGWSGTVTPSKIGYVFTPINRAYSNISANQTAQNYTATLATYTITGNTGIAGVTLSYTEGTAKTVVSDTNGNYSIVVPFGWSGTITPLKTGYVFTPASRTYSNISANQTAQNYVATLATYTITGNTGVGGVTLSYTSGTPKSVVSDSNGNYSISVLFGWSGTITPSKTGYVFTPANRTYSNIAANQTAQNYVATLATYTITGNTGVGGVRLSYTNGAPKAVFSDGNGDYTIVVSFGWSGTITPSKIGYVFTPINRTYNSIAGNQVAQNYTATPLYSISGSTGVAGVTLSYTDSTPKTVTSLADGSYSLTVLSGWSGTVTPTHACFTFEPTSRNYNNLVSNLPGQTFIPTLKPECADVSVLVNGAEEGRFGLPAQGSTRASFAQLNNGPVKIISTNAIPLIAAERVIYKVNGVSTSFSEVLGLPGAQLDKTYWLPWYNNKDLDTQLRFANVSGSTATVHLYINGTEMTTGCSPSNSPYTLTAGSSLRVSCTGINDGPVKIVSDQNIVAAERIIYKVNGINTSFSEMMALPNSQLSNIYWLPWYNNVDFDTQLRFANVSDSTATVHISIGGQEVNGSPFVLQANESTRVSLGSINDGPVKIESNQNIVAAERVIYKVNGVNTSFSETMALPNSQVNNTYWLPWYNNVDLDTQLRFANLSTTQQATVHISIGGQEVNGSPFVLEAGQSTRISLAGINNGPVMIESNQDIVVAERIIYKVNGINTSFSEMMALPNSQLDSIYWLPWYNNLDLDSQLRFGRP